ncbi:NADPH-flavin oxidoreductase [Streptomyces sp. CB02923]|uniref:flavin reductase family protein n=1 Tax=Streptomyces sp. CB02923 TaxID=1718985 RepID=UPI000939907D|nr:flavin reductase family protein [Streptomyces sp. CB02923]OKI03460.1 NADPH-flavin oxidoreductase [Streptomyces sp. CB02923]
MAATAVRYLRSVGAPTSTTAAAAAATAQPPARAAEPPRPALRAVREDERAPLDPAAFRAVLGHFASGVTVVTAPAPCAAGAPGDGPAGFACQSFASLSLDPPLVTFMVARTSTTWPRIARAGVFCVNILGADQEDLCRAFAVSGADKFAGVVHTPAPVTGSPRLAGAPAWVDCTIQAVHTGGDHLIVVGRVAALGTDPAAAGPGPLLFHRGAFGRFST